MIYTDAILAIAADPRIHWCVLADDGVIEFYLDNHMMQTFRACEERGVLDFVEGYGGEGRVWFLDLGSVFHEIMESYYVTRSVLNFATFDFLSSVVPFVWNKYDMFYYEKLKDDDINKKGYTELGGFAGLMQLMTQYCAHFSKDTEHFRVVGSELYFGKGKEVTLLDHLYNTDLEKSPFPFRVYLCGKIDLLIDDGSSIGPMDHKTAANFMGKSPIRNYEIHDGMTGYVYAARHLVNQMPQINRLQVNKIWMNCIQIKLEADSMKRFRRLPIYKTDQQLEQYRQRMISTAQRIFTLLSYPEIVPQQNHMMCSNYMHRTCTYYDVHRQATKEDQQRILDVFFVKKEELWNPEKGAIE